MTTNRDAEAADGLLILTRIARERGLTTLAELGDLPPLDPEERQRLLSPDWRPLRAVERDEEAER